MAKKKVGDKQAGGKPADSSDWTERNRRFRDAAAKGSVKPNRGLRAEEHRAQTDILDPDRFVDAASFLRRLADELDMFLGGQGDPVTADAVLEAAQAARRAYRGAFGYISSPDTEPRKARLLRAMECCAQALERKDEQGHERAAEWLAKRLMLEDERFHLGLPPRDWPKAVSNALARASSPIGVLAQLLLDTGAYGYDNDAQSAKHARDWIKGNVK